MSAHGSPEALLAVFMVLAAAPACEVLGGFKDYRLSADAGTKVSATSQDCDEPSPGIHGPTMARMRDRNGNCFWIDTTEVTVGQYAEFLADAAKDQGQGGLCAWNSNADADAGAGSGGTSGSAGFHPAQDCTPSAEQDWPRTCVDWCDAAAYCRWAGKRLCHDDGKPDGSQTKSEWVAACQGENGNNSYGTIDGDLKNGTCNLSKETLQPVGASLYCSILSDNGENVWDLTGNAAEWVDSCNRDTWDGNCVSRGGDFNSRDSDARCANLVSPVRTKTSPTLGFRCCATASGVNDG